MARKREDDLGPCIIGCGRDATHPKSHTCDPCYSSCRNWSNVKTPGDRQRYRTVLTTRMARLAAVDDKTVVIGTSPYKWKAKKSADVIHLNLQRRQRGRVR